MKKLTLSETWRLCLKMWRWIAKERKLHPHSDVYRLKEKWMERHNLSGIYANCLFCEYISQRGMGCVQCPGARIGDKTFDCYHEDYSFSQKPIEFYEKLVELNKIRLAKKKK